jgi:hypothetical protein
VSKTQRTKGAAGEREVAQFFSKLFGREIKRTLGQARDSGTDVDTGPLMIEVKRRKQVALLYEALDQAARTVLALGSRGRGKVPAVAVREDNGSWLFVCELDDLEAVARAVCRALETKELLS